ncbi:translational activator of cytochrome c oxidase 1 isoform X2 [Crotalus tigris]|uniref:translational activator of cytochrome c oxidase 1 isoform X2 n=1 Tax=Crotalus tigris TaxID=88082 RepID=UPI00192F9A38|nr:translational activator of cytochrome c oxidase 1 isoform X2 [Crotalus tigris]
MSVGCIYTRLSLLLRPPRLMLFHHPSCAIHASSATLAGHNKWSKVRHIKGPKDIARSLVFQKLTMMIRFAVREGGPNPHLNTNLANIIEVCRRKNMPKNSIETAISGAEKMKSIYHFCSIRGPGGSSFYVEILTDNLKRTSNEIRHLLNKNGGSIAEGIHNHFEKKGVVIVSKEDKSGSPVSLDQALDLAIEAGAEDVQEEEEEDEKVVFRISLPKNQPHHCWRIPGLFLLCPPCTKYVKNWSRWVFVHCLLALNSSQLSMPSYQTQR